MRRAGRAVSRSSMIEGVWGFGEDIESNTVDAFIRLLREKIDLDKIRAAPPELLSLFHIRRSPVSQLLVVRTENLDGGDNPGGVQGVNDGNECFPDRIAEIEKVGAIDVEHA